MISHMPWAVCLKLSGIVWGRWGVFLGQKIQNVEIERKKIVDFFLSPCKICLKNPCTSISASSAVLVVQGLLRQILI